MIWTDAQEFIRWVESQRRYSEKVSLDKMRYLCNLFDNPQDKFKSIHVTGTNGKGSTIAFLRSALMAHGLNVGTFTSPYITCFNERIGYNGNNIPDNELLKYANMIVSKYPKIEEDRVELPTFFEFITILMFLYFSELEDLDVAIIEVGIGGRLDSTNVIKPLISVITNVALDHMQILGDTLDKILIEKLGIVKENTPVVLGIKEQELKEIAIKVASKFNSRVTFVNHDKIDIINCDLTGSIFNYQDLKDIKVLLLGFHQIENAVLALEVLKNLKNVFDLKDEIILKALELTSWQGRLEVINKEPLILIDGSHNIDGMTRVCEYFRSIKKMKKCAIVSISHDKELIEMVNLIDNTFDEVVFTKYTYARSADAIDLYNLSKLTNKKIINSIDECLEYAKNNSNDLTVFLGSLYLVSEIKNKI